MKLILPVTPSQNTYDRSHWGARKRLVDDYATEIRAQLNKLGVCTPSKTNGVVGAPKAVSIVRFGSRILDEANMVGGAKALVDAMVREDLLYDDSPSWCRITYEQKKCKRAEARVEVTVEEMT